MHEGDPRTACARAPEGMEALTAIGFDGYAIGGLAVGETEAERNRMLDHTAPQLPAGVQSPGSLASVSRPPSLKPLPWLPQAEALGWSADGNSLFATGEFIPAPMYRITSGSAQMRA